MTMRYFFIVSEVITFAFEDDKFTDQCCSSSWGSLEAATYVAMYKASFRCNCSCDRQDLAVLATCTYNGFTGLPNTILECMVKLSNYSIKCMVGWGGIIVGLGLSAC